MASKELYKILKVGEDEYNINAVHSDAAAKTDYALTINKATFDGTENSLVFDGSETREISVVPSEGGTFSGPVAVKSLNELADLDETDKKRLAINYEDVRTIIKYLTGHPCYKWDGTELREELVEDEDIAIQKVKLVTGTSEGYQTFIAQEEKPIFFLYICEDTGQIFFGQDVDNYKQLGTNTLKVVYANDFNSGFTAEDLERHEDTLQEHTEQLAAITDPTNGTLAQAQAYTDEEISKHKIEAADNFRDVYSRIDGVEDAVEDALEKAKEYTDDEIDKVDQKIASNTASIATNASSINTNKSGISANKAAIAAINNSKTGILAEAKKYTNDEVKKDRDRLTALETTSSTHTTDISDNKTAIAAINNTKTGILATAKAHTDTKVKDLSDDIKDGTITAKKATAADKATKDGNDNTITSYYQKKITISDSAPKNTDGVNGDIWVEY